MEAGDVDAVIKDRRSTLTRACWSIRFPGPISIKRWGAAEDQGARSRCVGIRLPFPVALPVGDGDLRDAAAAVPHQRPSYGGLLPLSTKSPKSPDSCPNSCRIVLAGLMDR